MRTRTRITLISLGTAAILLAAPAAYASPGQSVTDLTTATPQQLVDELAGTGITTSNVTYVGAPEAAGLFSGMSSVGLDAGVVLSTGAATKIVGPNLTPDASDDWDEPGDADLSLLSAPNPTFDAAVLEFDFVPSGTILSFNYLFGSDEYNEFVNQVYDDAFAFYINGVNCAVIDDGAGATTPVTINTVNLDDNSASFRDNDADAGSPFDTEFDGMTTVLTCTGAVNQGQVNHLKLAIADGFDTSFNSAVMIEAGTISATVGSPAPAAAPDPAVLAATGIEPVAPLAVSVAALLLGAILLGSRRQRRA